MNNDKIVTPSFCYILAANFLLFFAFYLILPILPFYLKEEFMIGKSMIGFILSCYTLAALCIRPFAGYLLDTFARRPLEEYKLEITGTPSGHLTGYFTQE